MTGGERQYKMQIGGITDDGAEEIHFNPQWPGMQLLAIEFTPANMLSNVLHR